MSDFKRCASTIAAMEELAMVSSTGPTISKKRKTTTPNLQLRSSHITVSPETSVNSAGTVVSGEPYSDRSPLSSCSSSHVTETAEAVKTAPLDLELQTKDFETVDSTNRNFKSFSLLSEFSGDSEESSMFAEKHSAGMRERNRKMMKSPPMAEIEEFFATAERHEQIRFAEKYNFDIVRDLPLEGKYHWVRLH